MKAEILKMLRETGDYVSGQEICEKLGVSRTAVWKIIRQLQEEGYQVEAVRSRGYRIIDGPDVVTAGEVESLLDTEWAGKKIVCYPETDSTNIRIKHLGDEGAPHGTLAVADRQTAGRGRRGRAWESPGGSCIYMSILLRPDLAPEKAPMLTLVMACSAAEGIMDCADVKVQIKWPNDIIVNGKKLAGILTEMSTQVDYINHVTIGVGINVNLQRFPGKIQNATSLLSETGTRIKRAPVIAAVMKHFEENYKIFMQTEDMSGLMEKYSSLLVNQGREVLILEKDAEYKAYAEGINQKGELVVRREDGTVENICAGEVSVRGVYGYV